MIAEDYNVQDRLPASTLQPIFDHVGVAMTDCTGISITPHGITVTYLLRGSDGQRYAVGATAAHATKTTAVDWSS